MAKKAAPKPRLRLCAAAWTMTNYPSQKRQWSDDTKVRKAKEAGFDGFSAGHGRQQFNITIRIGQAANAELCHRMDVGFIVDDEDSILFG